MGVIYNVGNVDEWSRHGTYNFADPKAKWIWAHSDGATYDGWNNAPNLNEMYKFYTRVTVPEETNATLHTIIDNYAIVSVNGEKVTGEIGGGWKSGPNYPKIPIALKKGENDIDIKAWNTGGPGGFIASLITADGKVLKRTNAEEWYIESGGIPPPNPNRVPPPSYGAGVQQPPDTPLSPSVPVDVTAAPTGPFGLSTTTLLMIGAGVLLLCIMLAFGSMMMMR